MATGGGENRDNNHVVVQNDQQRKRFTANIPAPSKLETTSGNIAQNWKRYKRSWQNYSVASRLAEERDEFQCAVFLATIGEDALDIFDGFKFRNEADKQNLPIVIQKFEEFCIGKTNEVYESYKFHLRKQEQDESIEAYVASLRQLARTCNFGTTEDRMIRDRVVVGVKEDRLREKLLEAANLTLDLCLEIGRSHETSRQQLASMSNPEAAVQKVGLKQRKFKATSSGQTQSRMKNEKVKGTSSGQKWQKSQKSQNDCNQRNKCGRCGKSPSHPPNQCPARYEKCFSCDLTGHYEKYCRTKKKRVVGQVDDSDEDFILGSITEEKTESINKIEDPWHAEIQVNTCKIKFRVDTGADVSVVPEKYFRKGSPAIKPTTKKLYGPGQMEINVVGVYDATLKTETTETQDSLYVVRNLKEPLLGRPAIEGLRLLQRINKVETLSSKEQAKKEHPQLWSGMGKMKKEYLVRLKEDAQPYSISAPRRLALPMRNKVKEELKSLEEQEIIRPVVEPTDWCAPIVAVPKPTGKIRLCVDFSRLNESVKRETFPLPTTDELLAQLDGAKFFTKLDCNSGFHQLPLAKESQLLTTFITPFGRYCYQRLPFGISSGPEIFHREMSHILAGIPGVVVDIDDILVGGRTQEELDGRVKQVLNKLTEAGVTLNEKCVFSTDTVKFLGHIISPNGIQIDPEKVKAIRSLPQPQNISDLRRFLGMTNQVNKFTEKNADMTKPLRDLLKKDNDWIWGPDQERAFQSVKESLSSAPTLAHYCAEKETKVSADASSYGIGAVLMQKENGEWRPICYASRSLTSTEQRYAQVEKEALAITWSCERFADYLVGLPTFLIETDHKPLLSILQKKSLDELTPRLQRFKMRLMRFVFTVEHTAGKNLITADALSRAPVSAPAEQDMRQEVEMGLFVRSVIDDIPITDLLMTKIQENQNLDEVCSRLIHYVKTDHWPDQAKQDQRLKSYWTTRNELTVQDGLLLFQSRIVVPELLQEEVLKRIHQGHQGVVKCRALARRTVWWPGLSKQLETLVQNCPNCEKTRLLHPEPLNPTPTPDYPWQQVATDLFDWKGHDYLLLVDYYSRWIEIAHLAKTDTTNVKNHMKAIFARLGIPELVKSDYGTQYMSREFARFAESYGFTHTQSDPCHQSDNGAAERAVQTIKNLLSKADDPYLAMLNYRVTPQAHGFSPAELMFGRTLRTRIPTHPSQFIPRKHDIERFRKKNQELKMKMKENFDRRHRAKPLPPFQQGEKVWMKTPRDQEAEVLNQAPNRRSVQIKTERGTTTRRTRNQLRRRSQPPSPTGQLPRAGSVLPQNLKNEETLPPAESDDIAMDEPPTPMRQHPNNAQAEEETYHTRSGRASKPRDRLDL